MLLLVPNFFSHRATLFFQDVPFFSCFLMKGKNPAFSNSSHLLAAAIVCCTGCKQFCGFRGSCESFSLRGYESPRRKAVLFQWRAVNDCLWPCWMDWPAICGWVGCSSNVDAAASFGQGVQLLRIQMGSKGLSNSKCRSDRVALLLVSGGMVPTSFCWGRADPSAEHYFPKPLRACFFFFFFFCGPQLCVNLINLSCISGLHI